MSTPTLNYAGPAMAGASSDARFHHPQYVIRKKVFKLMGAAFHVYDLAGNVVMYSKQKAFKLREDIRLYTGEDMQTELLTIQARQIIDFSAAYDVIDPRTGGKVGALRRKGLKSMLRDEWVLMDARDQEIGLVQEDTDAARDLYHSFAKAEPIYDYHCHLPQALILENHQFGDLAEIWLGRWVRTDTYIFDASYVAAALRHIRMQGWSCGWGLHIDADLLWNGKDDAFLGGRPTEQDPMLKRTLCVVSDPLELVAPAMKRNGYRYLRSVRAIQWNMLAPSMARSIGRLRVSRVAPAPTFSPSSDPLP